MRTRSEIEELKQDGLTRAEIAARLGLARPTVDYHCRRLEEARTVVRVQPPASEEQAPEAREAVETRARVAELLDAGLSRSEIGRRIGVTKGTVAYHARRLGAPIDDRCARRYDWRVVQAYYDAGHSLADCIVRYGFSRQSWHEAMKRGVIVPRPAAMPLEDLLVAGVYRGRRNLKLRLLREGLKDGKCEFCGLSEWRDRLITLALHHANGDRDDNRLANLRLLCPNCHSQTENFAGRNGRRRRDEH